MADRYIVAGRKSRGVAAGDEWWPEARETVDVIVEETAPRDTGLVDQYGMTIWRVPKRERCGF